MEVGRVAWTNLGPQERLDRIRFGGSSVSERELELWGSTRRQDGWGMRVELQVRQDANDHTDLGDQCDQTSLLATHATTQDVEPEDAPHELRPQVTMGWAPRWCGGMCSWHDPEKWSSPYES